ncbi:hypothetical protein NO2_0246 [Candidatus Termititenax persephonae]|uniref:Uncharacterized protein n=1 Tax=Candidatus Termititenax persephonae TaxID=2218525 RepID=A0A388TH35_9BACT|nr:hypothetical protein NO2_0246 [Candidatus Termititenax persephonae]
MASPYTSGYAGITKGVKAEAGKMTAALNLLERVANKTDAVTANSTAAQYPSAKAAHAAIAALSGAGLEITDNKVTSTTWGANDNKNSDVKYPSCGALEAAWNAAVSGGGMELTTNRSDYDGRFFYYINSHDSNRIDISMFSTDDKYPTVEGVINAIWRRFRMHNLFTARK